MTFDEVLAQILDLLRREGRVSYRALKRRLNLDDEYLEDIKAEIIQAKKLAVDEDSAVLVWTGEAATGPTPASDQVFWSRKKGHKVKLPEHIFRSHSD
jgi:hypothetical protein